MRNLNTIFFFALVLCTTNLVNINASYCGKSGVPYSFEVLSNGAPILGCAQPSCVVVPSDEPFVEDSEFLTDINGQADGFFREGDRVTKHYRHKNAPTQIANCSGSFNELSCSRKNQWVGGIEYIDHPRQPLILQCCTFPGLHFSQEVGSTIVGPGEAITGGEVIRNGRQISFDVIANVKKIVSSNSGSLANTKVNYEITVRRMNCLPDPPEPEIQFDENAPNEVFKVLSSASNKDVGTSQKFEKKSTLKIEKKPKQRQQAAQTEQRPEISDDSGSHHFENNKAAVISPQKNILLPQKLQQQLPAQPQQQQTVIQSLQQGQQPFHQQQILQQQNQQQIPQQQNQQQIPQQQNQQQIPQQQSQQAFQQQQGQQTFQQQQLPQQGQQTFQQQQLPQQHGQQLYQQQFPQQPQIGFGTAVPGVTAFPTFPTHTFPSLASFPTFPPHTFPTFATHTFSPHTFSPHTFPTHSFPTFAPLGVTPSTLIAGNAPALSGFGSAPFVDRTHANFVANSQSSGLPSSLPVQPFSGLSSFSLTAPTSGNAASSFASASSGFRAFAAPSVSGSEGSPALVTLPTIAPLHGITPPESGLSPLQSSSGSEISTGVGAGGFIGQPAKQLTSNPVRGAPDHSSLPSLVQSPPVSSIDAQLRNGADASAIVPFENTVVAQPAALVPTGVNSFAPPTLSGIPPPPPPAPGFVLPTHPHPGPPIMGTILDAFQGQTHPISVPGLGVIGYSNAPQKKRK